MRTPAFRVALPLGLLVLVLLAAGIAGAKVSASAEKPPVLEWAALAKLPTLDRAERVVLALEQAEARGESGGAQPPWIQEPGADDPARLGERVVTELDSLLALNPGDVRANLLFARLVRALAVARPVKIEPGEGPPLPEITFGPCFKALDRALALAPGNAEIHYWKARLCGTIVPRSTEEGFHLEAQDLPGAVASARRAVELAPRNEIYREALALYLISSEQSDEAAEVMRAARQGRHPLSRLIEDWKRIPLPPGATLLEGDPGNQREMVIARGLDYPMVRVRCYAVFARATAVEKFYRQSMPGFRLFSEGPPQGGLAMFSQFLTWRDQALEPAGSAKMVFQPGERSGVMMVVTEFHGEEALKLSGIQEPIGDVACWIYLSDMRPSESR